jgi:hypothetical protein
MEFAVKFAWSVVALIHLPPAAVVAAPRLIPSLYGVAPDGALGLLLVHRGVLFLAIVAACIFAALDPAARRVVSVVASISVVGFLAIYVQAGLPAGALRTIALGDIAALVPLAFATYAAWRPAAA